MTTYAVLTPDDGSTFHAREQQFATALCDRVLYLTPDGLADEGDGDLDAVDWTQLANETYKSIHDCDWTGDDEVYVLIEPSLLDRETTNRFRRSLRVVFERVPPQEHFPYDQLESTGRRAGWLTNSLDAGEIVPPNRSLRRSVTGVDDEQSNLRSF